MTGAGGVVFIGNSATLQKLYKDIYFLALIVSFLFFLKKIWANLGLFFVYFRPFHITNQLQIEKV